MSLTSCIRRAGDALDASDREFILTRARALRAEGVAADEAGRRAVDERLAEVQAMVAGEVAGPAKDAPAKLEDVGEKIGGARKDTAVSTGPARKRATDEDRPAWARRFKISQNVTGMDENGDQTGRWVIRDSRSLDWMKQPKQVGRSTFATKEEAEAFLPIAAVGLKHRVVMASTKQGEPDRYEIWRDVTDRKRVKVVEQTFATRDEAMAYMVKNAVAIVETNTTFGEADLPAPPDRERTGPERRTGNVTGEDFKAQFGFRGVEFGNWNNQEERQALMNDAWDGLLDLAEVLGLPPRAIGLNGDLALAFGARGQGLQSARAHYESDRAVINLTKENGAGSLAHEFFHALDHYFGRQDGKTPATWEVQADGTRTLKAKGGDADMASGGFLMNRSGVRPEVRAAYEKLLKTMVKKAEVYVEDAARVDKFTGQAREELARELDMLRKDFSEQKDVRYWKRNNKPASAEVLAEFDTLAKAMLDGDVLALTSDWRIIRGKDDKAKAASRYTNDGLERLGVLYKQVRGRSGFSAEKSGLLDRLRGYMTRYAQRLKMLDDAQSSTEKTRMVPTDFAMNARELDQGRGGDYWTTPHELVARAFQGYVEDKIAERGGTSRFLNYAPENAAIITPWGFKRPYPAGAERKAINAAFDEFLATLQTRTDDDGNVALFSRTGPAFTNDSASPAKLRAAIAKIASTWGTTLATPKVVDTVDDLPPRIRQAVYNVGAENQVRGLAMPNGDVYLVADNIGSVAEAQFVLFHEVYGHVGMRAFLGDSYGTQMRLLRQANPTLAKEADKWFAAYGEAEIQTRVANRKMTPEAAKRVVQDLAIEEALADRAGDAPELKGWQRVMAALQRALRKIGLGSVADMLEGMTEAETLRLLADARATVKGQQQAVGRMEPAMSREGQTSGIIRVKEVGGMWAVVRNAGTGNESQLGYYDSESAADEAAERARTTPVRSAGGTSRWWSASGPEFIRSTSAGQLDSVDRQRAVQVTLDARKRSIKTREDGLSLEQIEDRAGYCYACAAQAAAAGLGDMVIGVAHNDGSPEWHAVVMRDGAVYDPTFGVWFEPGVYEALGFTPRLTIEPQAVRDHISQTGFAPDARNQQLGKVSDVPLFSRAPQTDSKAFRDWFGGSKVVDAKGKPLVVYHGTQADITRFDAAAPRARIAFDDAQGFYFTADQDLATRYAGMSRAGSGGANVMPVYLSIKNPKRVSSAGSFMDNPAYISPTRRAQLEAQGFDGIILDDGREIVAFRPEQIKSAIGNVGTFDPADPDIRFSRTPNATPGTGWAMPEGTKFDNFVYRFQDKNVDLKRAVAEITKGRQAIEDRVDAYLQEELFHERAAKRTQDFVKDELGPVMKEMGTRGITMDALDEYLHNRHAEEANKVVAERNLDDQGKSTMPDGGSGIKTADARAYLAKLDPGKRKRLEAVAAKVDAIIARNRQTLVDYGLESQEVVDGWASMFDHYVPLMREDEGGGGSSGTGQGFSIKGKESKSRTGATDRKVVDILANIAMQRERAIVRGEKNRVAVALVGLVDANPAPNFWQADYIPTERVFNDKTGLVEERQIPGFKNRPNVLVAKVMGPNGEVQERAVVFNEDNARAMRMVESLKNLDATQLEGVLGISAKITRYFASINTQYNPVFGFVNFIRDVQGAVINLTSTPIKGKEKAVLKDVMPALAGVFADARKARQGKAATSQWAGLWEEFQLEGGATGFRDLFRTSADRAKAIEREIDPTAWMNSTLGKVFTVNGILKVPMAQAQKAATWMFGWLSDYNLAMENAVRLSAYKVALDQGMTKQRAASLAKNLTVNFNRKGQAGMQAGALYAFFNASMQGTARMGDVMFEGQGAGMKLSGLGRKILLGGMALGAIQAMMLEAAGFDDDEPPPFVRERSLIIPFGALAGGKEYVSIPMPLGWHVIPNLGRMATEFALGGFKEPGKRAADLIALIADAFNPIGNSGLSLQTIAPTALDPLVALSENRDWTGKPIARESFDRTTPGFALAKDTASAPSKWISEAINLMSGGTKYTAGAFSPTPDQIDYLWDQVTGGVGRELSKVEQTATAAFTGETLPTYKIPLVGRFVGDAEGPTSQGNRFYENLNQISLHEAQIKGLIKDGFADEAQAYRAENPESTLIGVANMAERQVRKLRSRKRELLANDAPRDSIRQIEEQITRAMTRLNEAVERREMAGA
jgi:molybdopterin converting factor small subunit